MQPIVKPNRTDELDGIELGKEKMRKKSLFFLFVFVGITLAINAQVTNNQKTQAVPISNGCGSESSKASQIGAAIAKPIDAALTGTSITKQNASCDHHDKDYYNGVNKEKADKDFQQRSPIMGTVVIKAKETSNESYKNAQKDRETSNALQSTWEKENKQCLDKDNYRIEPKKN